MMAHMHARMAAPLGWIWAVQLTCRARRPLLVLDRPARSCRPGGRGTMGELQASGARGNLDRRSGTPGAYPKAEADPGRTL